MSELWIVVLARDPAGAKTRLAGMLDTHLRSRLVVAMLADVLAAARPIARTFIATESVMLEGIAARSEVETLAVPASGTNAAAGAAFRAAASQGITGALVIAADLPLIAASDVQALVDSGRDANVVIAPDRHRRGTNALLLSPPLTIAPAFGRESYRAHHARAEAAGGRIVDIDRRGLSHDVDEVEDLRIVLDDPSLGSNTAAVLASSRLLAGRTGQPGEERR